MSARRSPLGTTLLAVALVTLGATWLVSSLLQFPVTGVDDANIFLVYARNLSAGEGFVFNAGGERVEGFTSLLWVLICTAATILPGGPERWLLALNVLLVSSTIALCLGSSVLRRSVRSAEISLPWSAAFVALLLADYRYVAWNTVALMETALWATLLTASAVLLVEEGNERRRGTRLAIIVALLVLTRPEALLWAPVILILFSMKAAPGRGYASSLRGAAPGIAAYLGVAGAITLFRLAYFGFPFPNTFYAKVPSSAALTLREGGSYLLSYVVSGPVPFAVATAIVLSALHVWRAGQLRDSNTAALGAMALVGLATPAITGGDHFGGFRFYQSAYPVFLLALLNFWRFVAPQYVTSLRIFSVPRPVVLIGSALLTSILVVVVIGEWMQFEERLPMARELAIARRGRQSGASAEALFSQLHPHPAIGTITVGGFKYAYTGEVVDLMGLNDTGMAHNGGDRVGFRSHAAFEKSVFYDRAPDALIPLVQYSDDLSCMQRKSPFVDLVLKGLLDDPAFKATYILAELRRQTGNGRVALAAWYNRAFLDRVRPVHGFDVVFAEPHPATRLADCDARALRP